MPRASGRLQDVKVADLQAIPPVDLRDRQRVGQVAVALFDRLEGDVDQRAIRPLVVGVDVDEASGALRQRRQGAPVRANAGRELAGREAPCSPVRVELFEPSLAGSQEAPPAAARIGSVTPRAPRAVRRVGVRAAVDTGREARGRPELARSSRGWRGCGGLI